MPSARGGTSWDACASSLGYGFAALGGGGILFLIMYAVNAFIKWWQGG